MNPLQPRDRMGERILFTPGPLTTTRTVKEAMLIDIGSWDRDCIDLVREIREQILLLANGGPDLTVTPFQGTGSYAVEAVLGSALPRDGKLLILKNGAYGQRMALIAEALKIPARVQADPEDRPHDPRAVGRILDEDPAITHVACVHCETTTGMLNPLREIGLEVGRRKRRFIVDAVSSFAAYPSGPGKPIDFASGPIDHLVSSANKCVEGVPGFAFVISRKQAVVEAAGNGRSLSLDLHGQWSHLEKTGQFRFTPPTHVLLAFRQALRELEEEGGVEARVRRYAENRRILVEGMRELGFRPYLRDEFHSHVITTFHYPHEKFDFRSFYDRLHARGYIIYPGKLSAVDTFRIATIGSIGAREVRGLLLAIEELEKEGI
jgi:2-aminoethylphosphonate-pyruvate transaminase